jgi:hypothetical protein
MSHPSIRWPREQPEGCDFFVIQYYEYKYVFKTSRSISVAPQIHDVGGSYFRRSTFAKNIGIWCPGSWEIPPRSHP